MTIRVERLGHVLLVVRDVERSCEFYQHVLGLVILERDPAHGGVFLSAGDGSHILDIIGMPDPYLAEAEALRAKPRLGIQHFAFRVGSKEALRDAYFELIDRGVAIRNAVDHVNQMSVYVDDPDGNVVELYWERPDQAAIWERGRGDDDKPFTFERDPTEG